MTTAGARYSRYRRSGTPPNVQLTEDDIEILWQVFRNRVLDTRAIFTLLPTRSEQVIRRRLKLMFDAQFLDRLGQANTRLHEKRGSFPEAYALAREGARVLRDRFGADIPIERWTQKNRELRSRSIHHMLETSRFMVAMEAATRQVPDARLIHFDQILAEQGRLPSSRPSGQRLTIRTEVRWHGYREVEGTAPDQIFAVAVGGQRQYLFLEIDRGTETIEPNARKLRSKSFWRDTSLLRKFIIYAQAFAARAHEEQFGIPVFRVLTVTTAPERVGIMREACARHLVEGEARAKPGLFLFTDWQSIAAHDGSLLDLPIRNALGREIVIG